MPACRDYHRVHLGERGFDQLQPTEDRLRIT
jgi:hypothetical protein